MACGRGLLLWTGEEIGAIRELLADLPDLALAPLDDRGQPPRGLPRLDPVVVLADWARLARGPEVAEGWRRDLGSALMAVVVLAHPAEVAAAVEFVRPHEFDDVVELPAHPAHLALEIRRLFQRLAEREAANGLRAECVRQAVDFREFNRVALALSAERDVNGLLELILTKCREVTTADAGSLYLVEEQDPGPGRWTESGERVLRFAVAQNDSTHLDLKAARLPLNRSTIAGYVALTRTPLNLADVYRLPPGVEFSHSDRMDRALGYRTVSMLALPMVDHTDAVIGVVQVINKKRSPEIRLPTPEAAMAEALPFGPRDQELVSSLASLAAVALNKALLITRIEQLLEGIVRASVTAIEQRDPVTAGHSDRVARLTVGLAQVVDRVVTGPYAHVRFSREELKEIEYASLLHDIGKVGVREHVLLKAKKLPEWELRLIGARFDFIKRTLQYECTRRALELVTRLGPDGARPQVKGLEEELERRLEELDRQFALIRHLNEPSVVHTDLGVDLTTFARQRYRYFDGSEWPYLTEDEILNLSIPAGSLNDAERQEIESHVTHSFRFLQQIPWTKELRRVPLIAYSHHERLDGSGYPRRIRDVEIPVQARMMMITDVYDALTAADRPYKPAVAPEGALDILRAEARAGRIDRDLLDLFIEARVFATRPGRR